MRTVLVVYGATEPGACPIAEFVSDALKERGIDVAMVDSAASAAALIQPVYAAAIVCASSHGRKLPAPLASFVKHNIAWLEGIPSALVTVGSIAAPMDTPERRALREIAEHLGRGSHWTPGMTHHVTGAWHSRFERFRRWILERIPGLGRGVAETSGDRGPTDWAELTRFVEEFVESTGLREDGRRIQRTQRDPEGTRRPPGRAGPRDGTRWQVVTHADA
jgi:menaquinone-dependent protoporphyrinogen oxidase